MTEDTVLDGVVPRRPRGIGNANDDRDAAPPDRERARFVGAALEAPAAPVVSAEQGQGATLRRLIRPRPPTSSRPAETIMMTSTMKALFTARRTQAARQLGREAAQNCLDFEHGKSPTFAEQACAFIVDYVRKHWHAGAGRASPWPARWPASARTTTAPSAGVYALRSATATSAWWAPARACAGHGGTAGGRLYAPGEGNKRGKVC